MVPPDLLNDFVIDALLALRQSDPASGGFRHAEILRVHVVVPVKNAMKVLLDEALLRRDHRKDVPHVVPPESLQVELGPMASGFRECSGH